MTPVVLPERDDHDYDRARALMDRAIIQAGLDAHVRDFSLQKEPHWAGSLLAGAYEVPRYLNGFGRWHATVEFRSHLRGPIGLGAGRHSGIGLFAVADG